MRKIYRTYSDTEVTQLSTRIECPYCGKEWLEPDLDECGTTYNLNCDEDDDGCGKDFEMYFDAS